MADPNNVPVSSAVEAAAAPEIDISAAPSTTTGTTTIADDVAMAASSLTAATSAPGTGVATPNPGTGATTPFVELDENGRRLSIGVSIADICAKAGAAYNNKKYEEAADLYAQAAEWQDELNGEMNPKNADVLFRYGQALFKVGQSKSNVLGNNAPVAGAGDKAAKKAVKKVKKTAAAAKPAADASAGEAAEKAIEEKVATMAEQATEFKQEEEAAEKKPFFQFSGDENLVEDSDEEDAEEEGEEGEEEQDDLALAFEILDMARVLYLKRLEAEQAEAQPEEAGNGENAPKGGPPAVRHIKERLGDTHDLLAEISLENEKFTEAIKDSRASLKYKQEIYEEDSEIIAEAHFKLSLALEFASVTSTKEEDGKDEPKPVDQGMRDEAAKELQAAIDSTKLKLQAQQVDLATVHSPEDNDETRQRIADVQEMIADMEQRLIELKNPPIDVNAAVHGAAKNALGGLFGAPAGSADTEARIEEAKKTATDLTGLVRKKKGAKDEAAASETTNGKRKAEGPADAADETESKKARVEETADA